MAKGWGWQLRGASPQAAIMGRLAQGAEPGTTPPWRHRTKNRPVRSRGNCSTDVEDHDTWEYLPLWGLGCPYSQWPGNGTRGNLGFLDAPRGARKQPSGYLGKRFPKRYDAKFNKVQLAVLDIARPAVSAWQGEIMALIKTLPHSPQAQHMSPSTGPQ